MNSQRNVCFCITIVPTASHSDTYTSPAILEMLRNVCYDLNPKRSCSSTLGGVSFRVVSALPRWAPFVWRLWTTSCDATPSGGRIWRDGSAPLPTRSISWRADSWLNWSSGRVSCSEVSPALRELAMVDRSQCAM